jgi:hypothetical protein
MKTTVLLLTVTINLLAGCATPAGRHYTRVERRYDRADHVAGRVEARQYNRYDRRSDRYDRVNTRYSD